MEDLVSFVIPVYNAEKFIVESIESCINQTYKNIEVVVVNDGSTDYSEKYIRKLVQKYNNIRFIDLEHQGKVNAINEGIKIANGKYIAIQAADDVCFLNRIDEELKVIKSHKDINLVFGDMEVVDEHLNLISKSFWQKEGIRIPKNNYFENLLWGNFVSGGTVMFKSDLKNKIFPIPEKLLFEDWWIALNASYYGNIAHTESKLIKYRQHLNNDNAAINEKNVKELVKRQLKLVKRNFDYYTAIQQFILVKNDDLIEKHRYNSIVQYAILLNKLIIEEKFIKRIKLIKECVIVEKVPKLNNNIIKIFIYCILGKKLLYIKNYLK